MLKFLGHESDHNHRLRYTLNGCGTLTRGSTKPLEPQDHLNSEPNQVLFSKVFNAQESLKAPECVLKKYFCYLSTFLFFDQVDPDHLNCSIQVTRVCNATEDEASSSQAGLNTILRVVVEQMVYPVTLDVLHQIFSRFGEVVKIVTFAKDKVFQALVQFSDLIAAQAARLNCDGHSIYQGCCTLKIAYSKLTYLNVRYNNEKSRDYTRPNLPRGEEPLALLPRYLALALSNFGLAGYPYAVASALARLKFSPSVAAAGGRDAPVKPGKVLLVSNLNEEAIKCDHLFVLFGVYGDVQRVKVLFNKRDSALVQMIEAEQATLVRFFRNSRC